MDTESYWKQFESSGKVEDYLSYSRVRGSDPAQDAGERRKQEMQKGEMPYAGSDYGNRNGIKSDAYR